MFMIISDYINESGHKKTHIWDSATRQDSNQPTHLLKLSKFLDIATTEADNN